MMVLNTLTQYRLHPLQAYPATAGLEALGVALNGTPLALAQSGALPALTPTVVQGVVLTAPPHSVTFCVFGGL